MNGHQIEAMLRMIDGNIDLTREEVARYIGEHQQEIAESLAKNGKATIHLSSGNLSIAKTDLKLEAAAA